MLRSVGVSFVSSFFIFIFFGCNPKPVEVVYSPDKPDTMPTLQVAVIAVLSLFQFPLFFDASLFFAWGM